jgi:hypothetical protein
MPVLLFFGGIAFVLGKPLGLLLTVAVADTTTELTAS